MSVINATSEQIRTLLNNASIEMTLQGHRGARRSRDPRAQGHRHLHRAVPEPDLDDLKVAAKAVREAGLNPVPHVPARRIKDRAEVASIAHKLTQEAGATRMLLIAGDMPAPEGAFDSTIGVLETGEFTKAGIKTFYMAGHPKAMRT